MDIGYSRHRERLEQIYNKRSHLAKTSMIDNSQLKVAQLRKAGRKMVEKSRFV